MMTIYLLALAFGGFGLCAAVRAAGGAASMHQDARRRYLARLRALVTGGAATAEAQVAAQADDTVRVELQDMLAGPRAGEPAKEEPAS